MLTGRLPTPAQTFPASTHLPDSKVTPCHLQSWFSQAASKSQSLIYQGCGWVQEFASLGCSHVIQGFEEENEILDAVRHLSLDPYLPTLSSHLSLQQL